MELLSSLPPETSITALLWLVLVSYFVIEYLLHRRVLAGIGIRIHVNGTRGKTSVARLIAAGLRAGGMRVCAKTSGTLASVTDDKGNEFPVFRLSQPNIHQQLGIMLVEVGVGITVASVMIIIFLAFARREKQ